MVKPSQYLPSNAQAMFDGLQGLLPRERKFKLDRPQERKVLKRKERVVLTVRRGVAA